MEIEGIVLAKNPYKEKDLMVEVLTKDGSVSFKAKGALKISSANLSSLNEYSYSRFELVENKNNSSILTLKSGSLIRGFDISNQKIEDLLSLSLIGETSIRLLNQNEKKVVYPFLVSSIEAIRSKKDALSAAMIYFAHIISLIGYEMNVNKCAICGDNKGIVSFSLKYGGLICKKCIQNTYLHSHNEHYIKIFRFIFMAKEEDCGRVNFEKNECLFFITVMNEFIKENLDINIRSVDLMLKALR